MPRKNDFARGLETILNNPETNFLKNPKTFNEIHNQSQMPLSQMIRHVGKTARRSKNERHEPTDAEKSEMRLKTMERKS
jgi:hypothetical protein